MPGKSRSSKKTSSSEPPPSSRNTRKRYRNGSEAVPEESQTTDFSKSKTKKKTTTKKVPEGQELVVEDNPDTQPNHNGDRDEGEGSDVIVKKDLKNNVLKCLDQLQYGYKRDRYFHLKTVQNHFVKKSIEDLVQEGTSFTETFTRRITAMAWHEKYPYDLASGSKFGDISWTCGVPEDPSNQSNGRKFDVKAKVEGGGPGYAVTAMKFHDQERHLLFRSSINGTVARLDFISGKTFEYYNTGDWYRWFCSMDINFPRQMLVAGDNKGMGYQFTIDGKMLASWKLHRSKIHHCEFSKKDPNLLVTSSLEKSEAVRIWDIRSMRQSTDKAGALYEPLKSLAHNAGLNCAKFSPVDGSRLLTSDQNNEIRVYQGPFWEDYLTIKHHHRQFQHITPIKAEWHPMNDYIVIGKYPSTLDSNGKRLKKSPEARAIEFFDSYSGELVSMIYPPLDEICSLNVFNPTGEYLATGINSKLLLWRPGGNYASDLQSISTSGPAKIAVSAATRNILRGRGRRAREYSPVSDDGEDSDEDFTSKKKKARTANASGRTTTANNSTTTTNTRPSKKKK